MPANPAYLRDLKNQPQALRDTIAGLRSQSIPTDLPRRIVLTGMGSSYHVFHPLHQRLVNHGGANDAGLNAFLVETSELLYAQAGLLRAGTLVIAASQSGHSAETVALTELLAERRRAGEDVPTTPTLLGVTNTADSPLATRSDLAVLTRAGEEFTVSCKTYLAMLAALTWLEAALLGEDTGRALDELESAVPAVEAYLAGLEGHVQALKERMARTRDLFFVGRGRSLAAVGLGGLINKEAAHVHAEGLSSAAFRHGPFEMAGAGTFVIVYEGEGAAAALNRRLYDDIAAAGIPAGWVSTQSEEPAFRLAKAPARALPLLEALPAELTTLALADLKSHEAGTFTRGSKITTVE